ncbi:MAG: tetratricopeptide repeat protein, partial [Pontixanthobacter sp.]
LYRQAAQSGQAFAMWRLAVMIDEGEAEGTLEEAVEMLKAAADLGYSNAWASLGVMHATGHGTDTDFAAAIEAYQRASEMGNSYGFHGLGVLYYDGQGVPANDFEAMAYWYVAAMMDNSGSQDNFEQFAGDFSDEEMGRILARAQEIAEMFELDLMF